MTDIVQDMQRFFDIHHARNDVFENVNKRELELGAANMAALIYLISMDYSRLKVKGFNVMVASAC